MAMNNIEIRKKQLKRLDEFVHGLYQETQMLKQYGEDLPDLEGLYLHIHDVIQDLLSVPTTQEFMDKIAEFHKGIAGIVVIIGAGDPHEVAEELKKAQNGMSDVDVEEFLKNMKVKEKSAPVKPQPKAQEEEPVEQTEEEREAEKKDLVDTLDLNDQVTSAKPKARDWGKNTETTEQPSEPTGEEDPLDGLWQQWKNK